jgi:hypothetical protein
LEIIIFTALLPSSGLSSLGPSMPDNSLPETRIEDGKLLYERRWYGTIL